MSDQKKKTSTDRSSNNDDSGESSKKGKNPIKKVWTTITRKLSVTDKHEKEKEPRSPIDLPASSVQTLRQSFEPAAFPPRPPEVFLKKTLSSKQSSSNLAKPVLPLTTSPPKPPRSPIHLSPPKPPRTYQMVQPPPGYLKNTMSSEAANLFDVFNVFSTDDTSVTLDRVGTIYRIAGLTPTQAQVQEIVDGWKAEHKTSVNFSELHKGYQTLAANPEVKGCTVDEAVGLLDNFDYDGRGIAEPELRFLLSRGSEGLSDSEINQLISEVSVSDGVVNVSEISRKVTEE